MRIARDQRRHTTIICPTESTPLAHAPRYTNDFVASPVSSRPMSGSLATGRDRTFAGYDSNTLPAMKLKQRQKRPKSGGVLPGSINRVEEMNTLMAETDQCERLQCSLREGNMDKSFVVKASYLDNNLNPFKEDPVTRQLNSSVYLDHSYSNNSEMSQYLGASIKSLPEGSHPPTVQPDQRCELFKSMPGIPNTEEDYGIYGDDDELDDTVYLSTTAGKDSLNAKLQLLGNNQRSKSHGDMLQDGSESPSQQQIALSLAKSLTDERLNEPEHTQVVLPRPQVTPFIVPSVPANGSFTSQRSNSTRASKRSQRSLNHSAAAAQPQIIASRPKSAVSRLPVASEQKPKGRPRSAVLPNAAVRPRPNKDSMWNSEFLADDNVPGSPQLNFTINEASIDRPEKRKKKKDKGERVLESLNVTTIEGHKKKGFRDSLKQIFFKKR